MIFSPSSDFDQQRTPPAGAMRLLFGASAIDAMPEAGTEIRNVGDLRVRAEQTSRAPEVPGSCAFSDAARAGITRLLTPLS